MTDPNAVLLTLGEHPAFRKHNLIGSRGFGLPVFKKPAVIALTEEARPVLRERGIELRGQVGKDNLLLYEEEAVYTKVSLVCYGGSGNVVALGSDNVRFTAHFKCFGAALVLGNGPHRSDFDVRLHGKRCGLFVGPCGSSNGTKFHVQGDESAIMIGEDHMFAWNIELRNQDGHGIFDIDSGALLNPVRDIILEPHVWVGFDAAIFKGVRVGAGSIVGAKSVLTKDVPRCSAYAGNPAALRRSNVSWTRHENAPDAQVRAARKLVGLDADATGRPADSSTGS